MVLDTNVVLDLWVFDDLAAAALRQEVESGAVSWLAAEGMRVELARVLDYPHLAARLNARESTAEAVLARFDRLARIVPQAIKAPFTCQDPDDQIFIDLAAAHGAELYSKDRAVLCMARRLARLGVAVVRPGG